MSVGENQLISYFNNLYSWYLERMDSYLFLLREIKVKVVALVRIGFFPEVSVSQRSSPKPMQVALNPNRNIQCALHHTINTINKKI